MNVTDERFRMNVTSDLYFDILPTNLRALHHRNEIVTCALSTLLNSTLIFLLLTETNKTLEAYSRVLIQNCIVDLVATILPFIGEAELEFIDGRIILILNGSYSKLARVPYHYLFVTIYASATGATIIVPTVFFYFRYVLIKQGRVLTTLEFSVALTISMVCSLNQGVSLSLAAYLNDNPARLDLCRTLLSHPVWLTDEVDHCLVTSPNDLLLWYFLFCATVEDVIVYSIMSFCTYHVVKHLSRSASSSKTSQLQKQLNRMLACQMIIPLFTGILPIMCVTVFTKTGLVVPGIGIIVSAAMTWMPLVSPFTTILFVASFHRRLFGYLRRAGIPLPGQQKSSAVTGISSAAVPASSAYATA